jgi:DNA-binding MarR family transcriptional regulator
MAKARKGPAKTVAMEETAGFALARACRAYRGAVGDALAEFGLHPGQEMVLLRLWREDGIGQSELAERVGVEASTMSNMLMRLERAGLVERRRGAADARSSRAYLTQRGRALQGPVEDVWTALEGRAFEGISREEDGMLRRALERVRGNLIEGERRRP